MRSSAGKIQLNSFDGLFGTGGAAAEGMERIQEIPLSELYPFKNHPFRVRDDEAMQETAESVAKYGVLVPGIVRPRAEGGYEIVAGHRRKRASELAGKETMPMIVRDLDDDEATIIMVDNNLQRETLLPSEKAFAYQMKLDAMKRQGERRDLTLARAVPKLPAREQLAQDAGEKSGIVDCWVGSMLALYCLLGFPAFQQGENDFLHLLGCVRLREILLQTLFFDRHLHRRGLVL